MDVSIAIVGSGFSGIGLAVRLREQGIDDYVVLERGAGVGGTWHYNTYPGCACDVPSHLYSFSFAPNPDWTRTYSRQPEILAYLERVAEDFGVMGNVRLNTDVRGADWDEAAQRWRIETSAGEVREGARLRHRPAGRAEDPRLPRAQGFQGPTFHSARWDHDADLKGRRVASVGPAPRRSSTSRRSHPTSSSSTSSSARRRG